MDQKKLRVFFYSSIHLYKITNILLLEEFRRLVIPMQKKNSWRKSNLVIEICTEHWTYLYIIQATETVSCLTFWISLAFLMVRYCQWYRPCCRCGLAWFVCGGLLILVSEKSWVNLLSSVLFSSFGKQSEGLLR